MLKSLIDEDEMELTNVRVDSKATPPDSPLDDMYSHMNSDEDTEFEENSYDDVSDYEIPTPELLDRKQRRIERYRKDVQDLKKRLIWDLSLAFKRNLCVQGHFNDNVDDIANISLTDLMRYCDEENPEPSQWISFIINHMTV